MENNKITLNPAARKERTNPIKRAFSAAHNKLTRLVTTVTAMLTVTLMTTASAFAAPAGGTSTPAVDGEAAFNSVIGFFATWIGRIGLVVAFVGGVMFALAIKNDDAEAKTRGLMTLASGFVVFALTLSLHLFGITA